METFEEKKRRDYVERYGENKGNRLADEYEGKSAERPKRRKASKEK